MSDQQTELQKAALASGIITQGPPAPPTAMDAGTDGERPELPTVQLPGDGRLTNDFAREIGQLVAGKGIYRYTGCKEGLVTVGYNDKTKRIEPLPVTPHRFRSWVENHLVCYDYQFSRKGMNRVAKTMAVEHASTCLESDTFRNLQPTLVRVNLVRLPVQRRDGTIDLLPTGYDAETGIFTMDSGWEYDEEMTLEAARHILMDAVREFPFQEDRSRSVFFCAALSQFAYWLMPMDSERLNFIFHANGSGSGKTLLVKILLAIAWKYASVDAMPEENAELRKRLDTAVLSASPFLVFDDLQTGYLKSGLLNSFISADWWSGRKFGTQSEFNEPKTPVLFFTANNLDYTPDISRRTLTCDLMQIDADPEKTNVEKDIDVSFIRQHEVHRQLASALWAIVKHWRDTGRKHDGRIVRGFEKWSRIYGGMTMAAGFDDPCQQREGDSFGNTEFNDMQLLVATLAEEVAKTCEYEFIDVINVCREKGCFEHLIEGSLVKAKKEGEQDVWLPKDKTNSSMGKLLARYGGRRFHLRDGTTVVFDKRGKNRHRRYTIEVVRATL